MKRRTLAGLRVLVLTLATASMLLLTQRHSSVDRSGSGALQAPQAENFSILGRRLYLGQFQDLKPQPNNFSILVWKFGPQLERRHIHHFGPATFDPFDGCSVSNCRLTYKDADLAGADAVLFHLHQTSGPDTLPRGARPPAQRWVFLTDETPYNTFMFRGPNNRLSEYNGLFNWSMTYRPDSDVPVPYGRTVPLSPTEITRALETPEWPGTGKSALVAIMVSHCSSKNGRMEYVTELQKYIPVDVYGNCGTLKCPGHFGSDCKLLNKYKFYLAFENSNCRDYLTEKVWWNALAKGAVPVVMGAAPEECARLLPPGSYVHVADFASPAKLAAHLLRMNASEDLYGEYFRWKRNLKVVNEHGYFQTPVFHYCRLCEALNYNDPAPKVYEDLDRFWSVQRDCYKKDWI